MLQLYGTFMPSDAGQTFTFGLVAYDTAGAVGVMYNPASVRGGASAPVPLLKMSAQYVRNVLAALICNNKQFDLIYMLLKDVQRCFF